MTELVIVSSRTKVFWYLALSLAFVADGVAMLRDPTSSAFWGWFISGFFGAASFVFLCLLVRPQRLTLDQAGFTVSGGLMRSPRKVFWQEVDPFFVYRLPRGGNMIGYMIGYNFKPGARERTRMLDFSRRLGADGALPRAWPGSAEHMVDELNSYRTKALDRAVARS